MGKLKKIIEKAKMPFGTNNYTLWAKGVKEGYDRGYEKAKEEIEKQLKEKAQEEGEEESGYVIGEIEAPYAFTDLELWLLEDQDINY